MSIFFHHHPSENPSRLFRPSRWQQAAADLRAQWRQQGLARHDQAQPLAAELQGLRDSGLVNLLVPEALGGLGGTLRDASQVVIDLARANSSIAALLAFHYYSSSIPRLSDFAADGRDIDRRSAAQRWLWGNISQPQEQGFLARPDGAGGYVVQGTKRYNTGAPLGDVISVLAVRTDAREIVYGVIPSHRAGIAYHDDWDHLGLRQTGTVSATFDNVAIAREEVIPSPAPRKSFPSLFIGYAFVSYSSVFLGTAFAALEAARDYTLTRAKPFHGLKSAADDPYILAGYGAHVARLQAAEALLAAAADDVQRAYDQRATLSPDDIGDINVRVVAARDVAATTALDVTAGIFDLTRGVGSTHAQFALDRYWRDVRTLAQHDPLVYSERALGDHFLRGVRFALPDFV
jgi:alkylation response protein AidB-like acyl-CoA dehydrogenase